MPHEIYDAGEAITKDAIAPLFTYKLGNVELDIYPSSAIEGEHSFNYVESQFYAAAVATEYEKLRQESQAVLDRSKDEGMTREIAAEFTSILSQMAEKEVELNTWTSKYIEALAILPKGKLVELLEPEVIRLNQESGKKTTLSKVVNNLYAKINERLKDITVETAEEEEAKLYDQGGDDEGKNAPPENDTPSIANGSLNASAYSDASSISLVQSA